MHPYYIRPFKSCFSVACPSSSTYRVFQKSSPPETFWNIFTSAKSFCVKFCKFVGNSYPHISANLCTFILIFHQMGYFFYEYPSFSRRQVLSIECRRFVSKDLARNPSFPVIPWQRVEVEHWKVRSRVDHTDSAVLRKPSSGTGKPVTASVCAVCHLKTIFPLVGPTKL